MTRILLTDSSGNPVERYRKSCVRRVLQSPVNVTACGKRCHAMVFSEQAGVAIVRDGASFRTCSYSVCKKNEPPVAFGPTQREAAIELFFKLCREAI